MDDGLERRVEALEGSQREIKSSLERHALATDAKLAGIDVRLSGIEAKLDAKASVADVAKLDAKLDSKASVADVAKLDAKVDVLVKVVGDLVIDIRTLRDNARTDYRLLFGALITVTLGLAGLMAKGFHWL